MTFLALGDSYTIGEGVPLHESFPYQLIQLLRRDGYMFQPAEIIAKTGWTTDELQAALSATRLLPSYDFVSLLIGVNNQYRERAIDEYRQHFETLLKKSIRVSGNHPANVFVLSIPDWGVTPFAANRDRKKIGEEIDAFNLVNQALSAQHQTQYIEITKGTREALHDESLLASDGLHPSAKEYTRWAGLLANGIRQLIAK